MRGIQRGALLVLCAALDACGGGAKSSGAGGSGGSTSGATGGGSTSGGSSGGWSGTGLIQVGGPTATVLIVDDDDSANNSGSAPTPSPSDLFFANAATGSKLVYNRYVVPSGAAEVPAASDLAPYSTILWYNGPTYGPGALTMSPAQEKTLEGWLDQGGKTLLVYSEDLVYDLTVGIYRWAGPEQDSFLAQYVGAVGDDYDVASDANGTLAHASYVATGAAGGPLAGMTFDVVKDTPIPSTADVINPKAGVDTLATVVADPDGTTDRPLPVATGNKAAGAKSSSTVVYVGMPVEDVAAAVGGNSGADFFAGVLAYAGL